MKKTLLISSLILSLNVAVYAAETTTSVDPDAHLKKHRPCMKIASACETAGYRLGDTVPDKNIWKNCVRPILDGQTISGVTADPADVASCKERREKWKSMHKMQKQENMPETSAPVTPAAAPTPEPSTAPTAETPAAATNQ